MSLAELKRNAEQLPESEPRELAAFLLQVRRERNPAWRGEIARRMREIDAGKKISQSDFERRIGVTHE